MDINLTLFAQAATFAIFIWFTAKFVWPHLARAIEARQKHIAKEFARAEIELSRNIEFAPGYGPPIAATQ